MNTPNIAKSNQQLLITQIAEAYNNGFVSEREYEIYLAYVERRISEEERMVLLLSGASYQPIIATSQHQLV